MKSNWRNPPRPHTPPPPHRGPWDSPIKTPRQNNICPYQSAFQNFSALLSYVSLKSANLPGICGPSMVELVPPVALRLQLTPPARSCRPEPIVVTGRRNFRTKKTPCTSMKARSTCGSESGQMINQHQNASSSKRIWTWVKHFSPWFHLPGFHFGVSCLWRPPYCPCPNGYSTRNSGLGHRWQPQAVGHGPPHPQERRLVSGVGALSALESREGQAHGRMRGARRSFNPRSAMSGWACGLLAFRGSCP